VGKNLFPPGKTLIVGGKGVYGWKRALAGAIDAFGRLNIEDQPEIIVIPFDSVVFAL